MENAFMLLADSSIIKCEPLVHIPDLGFQGYFQGSSVIPPPFSDHENPLYHPLQPHHLENF